MNAGLMLALLLMVTKSLDEADSQISTLEKIGYPVERLRALRELTARLRVDRLRPRLFYGRQAVAGPARDLCVSPSAA